MSETHPAAPERRSGATRWAAAGAHGTRGPQLALLRRLALTLLQHEFTTRGGIKAKRLKAGWDHRSVLQVLAG